jgi:hypothetical protein
MTQESEVSSFSTVSKLRLTALQIGRRVKELFLAHDEVAVLEYLKERLSPTKYCTSVCT